MGSSTYLQVFKLQIGANSFFSLWLAGSICYYLLRFFMCIKCRLEILFSHKKEVVLNITATTPTPPFNTPTSSS